MFKGTTSLVLLGLVIAATGCGSSSSADAPGPTLEVDAAADGSLAFATTGVETTPGSVRIAMRNPSKIPHAIGIRGPGVEETGETVGTGGESAVKATVKAGAYTLFCPVGGHEAAGMVATLTVR